MVQPGAVGVVVGGAAFNDHTAPVQHNGVAHGQLWFTVVIAGLGSSGAFAGQALPHLQQRRPGCVAAQVEPEAVALDPCEIAAAAGDGALSNAAGRCTLGAVGQVVVLASDQSRSLTAVSILSWPAPRQSPRGRCAGRGAGAGPGWLVSRVGEQQLPGGKGRLRACVASTRERKKRHLKPPQPPAACTWPVRYHLGADPVAAMVTGKLKGPRGQRQRIGRARPQGQRQPLAARAQGKAPGRRCEGHGRCAAGMSGLDWAYRRWCGAGCQAGRWRPRRGVRENGGCAVMA